MKMEKIRFQRFIIRSVAAVMLASLPFTGLCQDAEAPRPQYGAEGLRDPFKPYIVKEEPAGPAAAAAPAPEVLRPFPSFEVQGVFWGASYPQAIINNKIIKEGDIIEEAKVLSITKEKIRFLFTNREFSVSPLSTNPTHSTDSRKEAP